MVIQAHFISGKVTSNSTEAHNLQASSQFGERHAEKVYYALAEAYYLLSTKKMTLEDAKGKKMSEKDIERKFTRLDKHFKNNALVYADLRKKGYIVKTALKFGAAFRVYEKRNKTHAKWIVFPTSEHEKLTWQDFAAKNRVAHSTKKNLLIAVVDSECDVSYFEVSWTRP